MSPILPQILPKWISTRDTRRTTATRAPTLVKNQTEPKLVDMGLILKLFAWKIWKSYFQSPMSQQFHTPPSVGILTHMNPSPMAQPNPSPLQHFNFPPTASSNYSPQRVAPQQQQQWVFVFKNKQFSTQFFPECTASSANKIWWWCSSRIRMTNIRKS